MTTNRIVTITIKNSSGDLYDVFLSDDRKFTLKYLKLSDWTARMASKKVGVEYPLDEHSHAAELLQDYIKHPNIFKVDYGSYMTPTINDANLLRKVKKEYKDAKSK